MKFRDPKTGEVFEDIEKARSKFCKGKRCRKCVLDDHASLLDCREYYSDSPAEAARLMGYEVVEEDSAIEGMCCDCAEGGPCCDFSENEKCSSRKEDGSCWRPYTEKEKPMEMMDKPRICEVLGVEVGEEWHYNSQSYHIRRGDERLYVLDNDAWDLVRDAAVVQDIIERRDNIIRKPRFTEDEVADARALVRILGATQIKRTEYGGNLHAAIGDIAEVVVSQDLFPSLRPGQSVALADICGC